MIPSDLAARLRMLSEASFFDSEPPVQGPARVREIQARLPDLLPGQRFTAQLQRALPDGSFQAVVAGRTYTLALNHAAKPGDTLELVVSQTTPRAVFAHLAGAVSDTAPDPARPSLSPTARLISLLLSGQANPQPLLLAGGRPLLDAPPMGNAAALAPLLRQALGQSGLFYESHQSQWLAGKIETASLLREPQGQQSPAGTASGAGAAAGRMGGAAHAGMVAHGSPGAAGPAAGEPEGALGAQSSASQTAAQRIPLVPERLMPIVHQQLDALATQNYVWQGQVWPGQSVEWEIEDPQREGPHADEEAAQWRTSLRLTLPRLGGIEARLQLGPAGVALRLLAQEPGTVATLESARDRLDAALAAANVPLTGFVAEQSDAAG